MIRREDGMKIFALKIVWAILALGKLALWAYSLPNLFGLWVLGKAMERVESVIDEHVLRVFWSKINRGRKNSYAAPPKRAMKEMGDE